MSGWRVGLLVLCALALPGEAAARRVGLAFDLFAGGLHALSADIAIELAGDGYRVRSDIATQGFLDFLTRWRSRQESHGTLGEGRARPALHTRDGEWRFSRRVTRLTYDKDGGVAVEVMPPPEDDDRPPVPAALRHGTVDLLSALVQAATAPDPAAACTGGAAVYDGRRRYDVVFAAAGEETLPPHKYGSFAGTALRCRVTLTPVAGFRDADDSETGLGFPRDVFIWLAADAATGLVLPVRFQAEFDMGSVVGHLAAVTAPGG